jgi:hypothetical protein
MMSIILCGSMHDPSFQSLKWQVFSSSSKIVNSMISDLQETFACCCCRLFLTSAGDESGHTASTES